MRLKLVGLISSRLDTYSSALKGRPESTSLPKSTSVATPTQTAQTSPSSRRHIARIIGGTVGAGAILLLLVGILIFRRRAAKNSLKQEIPSRKVEPFIEALDIESKSSSGKLQELFTTRAQVLPITDLPSAPPDGIFVTPSNRSAEPSTTLSQGELYNRIDVLAREVAMLREQALPPEYEGLSDVGLERQNSRSVTLPSYNGAYEQDA
ncbi:hypothetical protein VNI00_016293 [Paramarasmius palmivorus]|uniref:Uncharacterized protein n=1 Tax=Paramarasmius palmivorus TaxID=297713 RepID=A0AAW0BEY0_9AGAR